MSDNGASGTYVPSGTGVTITPEQVVAVADYQMATQVVSNPGNGADIVINIPFIGNSPRTATITPTEYARRVGTAAAIMWGESAGHTDARCFDGPLPTGHAARAGQNANCNQPGRGVDRGLWQLNSKSFTIPDATADDPRAATAFVWGASQGFTNWGPWKGTAALTPGSPRHQQVVDQIQKAQAGYSGVAVENTPGPSTVGGLLSPISSTIDAAKAALGLAFSLAKWIANPRNWLRVLEIVGGIGLVAAAVLIMNKDLAGPAAGLAALE